MLATLLRLLVGLITLALASIVSPANSRPYVVDDILRTESFGKVLVSPGGRWLVFERRIPFKDAARFDLDAEDALRDRLYRVDLNHPGPASPLLSLAPGVGTVALGFSPHGTRLAIGRLDGMRWSLGVVTLATGEVRWFDLSPDYFEYVQTLAWLSDDRLAVIAEPGSLLPWIFRTNVQDAEELPQQWAATSAGKTAAATAVGSGRYIEIKPPVPALELRSVDVVSGAVRTLAHADFQQLSASPDGHHVALTVEAETIRIDTPKPIRTEMDLRRRRLEIVDADDGHLWSPCAACDIPFAPPTWSPAGDRLLFYSRKEPIGWGGGEFRVADVDKNSVTQVELGAFRPAITQATGTYDSVAMGWRGCDPLIFAQDPATGRRDWLEIGGSRITRLTPAISDPAPTLVHLPDDELLVRGSQDVWKIGTRGSERIMADAEDNRRLGSTDGVLAWQRTASGVVGGKILGGRVRDFTLPLSGDVLPLAASPETGTVIATATKADGEASLVVAVPGRAPIAVATINSFLESVSELPPIAIRSRLPDGHSVINWLYMPDARADGAKPVLITIPYAGESEGDTPPVSASLGQGDAYTNVYALVGHGYAVLLPSMPDLTPDDRQPFDFAGQVLSAVDAVIARGEVDPTRLGLWGHSYGGYTVAMIASETSRFSAIVASSGIYDLTSHEGTFMPRTRLHPGYGQVMLPWAGWTETEQPKLMTTPWSDSARYVTNSPVYRADRIQAPMLIIGGGRDFAPFEQGEQLFSALYRQGKDAELVTYWGEDHVVMSPANIRDLYARVFDWFDTNLGQPPGARPESGNEPRIADARRPGPDPVFHHQDRQ